MVSFECTFEAKTRQDMVWALQEIIEQIENDNSCGYLSSCDGSWSSSGDEETEDDEEDEIKERFLAFAKKRAEQSKGYSYEWELTDEEYFLTIVQQCPKRGSDWRDENWWDEIIDWYESLPNL